VAPEAAVAGQEGYDGGMKALAVVLTIFAPIVALIVALVMRANEVNPVKRAFLRTWAWISGGLVALYFVISILVAVALVSSAGHVSSDGPCLGGPVLNQPGVQVGPHKYRFACEGGGSTVVNLP
jgi:hypothetical protein